MVDDVDRLAALSEPREIEGVIGTGVAAIREQLSPELEVLRRVGSGPRSEVYLAREPALARLVAVKVLSTPFADDGVALQRFRREARALASLDHPNAVAVHRVGTLASGVPYLVMQFVKGSNLEEKLAAEGPVTPEAARRILAQVAAALAEAHRHDFVHRDVKPSNILCDQESGRVLVSDFGLAGILPTSEHTDPGLTRPGQVLGDLRYRSPEQIRGEPAGEGTDVYALGVLGYEILTGRGPRPNLPGAPAQIPDPDAEAVPLGSLRPDVDPRLASLLERAVCGDPARRPGAAYLADALSREDVDVQHGAGGAVPPVDLLNVLIERRVPQIVAVTAVLGLAVLGFFDMLADRGVLPEVVFRLVLATVGSGLAASGIIAWFHGERGEQKVTLLEVALLALVAVVWLGLVLLILLA